MKKRNKKGLVFLVKWLLVITLLFAGSTAVSAHQVKAPLLPGHSGEAELKALGTPMGITFGSYSGTKTGSSVKKHGIELDLSNVVLHDLEIR